MMDGRRRDDKKQAYEIVGVVANTLQMELTEPIKPSVYFPYPLPSSDRDLGFIVRAQADPIRLIPDVRSIIRELDPSLPVLQIGTMRQRITDTISRECFAVMILGVFGILSVALAVVGIYGVVSYVVSQRTHEMGIRLALGAQYHQIVVLVLKRGFIMSIVGSAIGVIGALALTRFLAGYLYGVSPTDWMTFALVPFLAIVVTMLACYIPARRAARIDPMKALRYE
jgi:ABC-type antimicrobial peptide transport system permease subunit